MCQLHCRVIGGTLRPQDPVLRWKQIRPNQAKEHCDENVIYTPQEEWGRAWRGEPGETPSRFVRGRLVGAAAIALAASIAIQNAMFARDRTCPPTGPDQGGARLARADPGRGRDRGRPGALNLPLLLLFVTVSTGSVGVVVAGADRRASWWPRRRLFAAVMRVLRRAVGRSHAVRRRADRRVPACRLIWQMPAASAWRWSLPALGTTFIGAALTTHAAG